MTVPWHAAALLRVGTALVACPAQASCPPPYGTEASLHALRAALLCCLDGQRCVGVLAARHAPGQAVSLGGWS